MGGFQKCHFYALYPHSTLADLGVSFLLCRELQLHVLHRKTKKKPSIRLMAGLHLVRFLYHNLLLRYRRVSRSRGNLFLNHIGVLDLVGKRQVQDYCN